MLGLDATAEGGITSIIEINGDSFVSWTFITFNGNLELAFKPF